MKLIAAFRYALQGMVFFFRYERNGKIQALCAAIALALGLAFHISATEWLFIITSSAMVFAAEMLNTAIEKMADFIEPRHNTKIKIIKDLAAGAVMIPAVASLIIGTIIFLPKIIEFFNKH